MSCPDAGTLAAYLDGGLFAEERERVEEHLSGCPACCRVMAETVRFQGADREDERRGGPSVRIRLVASVAAVLTAALLLDVPDARPRQDPRAPLLAATASGRPVLPRLTGGFAWAPLDQPLRSLGNLPIRGAEPGRWRYFAAAEEVRRRSSGDTDPSGLAAFGAANLLVGNVDEAVAILNRAVAGEPRDPRLHSDLAAALIARGMERGETADLADAVESASTALTLSAELAEARFNRALALELLPLPQLARREWRSYSAMDESAWSREGAERLAALPPPPIREELEVRDRLIAAAYTGAGRPNAELSALVRSHRHQARLAVQEHLLPAWGSALLAGDSAAAAAKLDAADALAREWALQTSDRALAAAVAEIRGSSPWRSRELARGWRRFGESSLALTERRLKAGREAGREASAALAGGSAQPWAETLELTAALYLGVEGTVGRLESLRPADPAGKARASWILGLAATDGGRYRQAIPLFTSAIEGYEALGEIEPVAWLHVALADTYSVVGDPREAWRHLGRALTAAPALADRARAARILLTAADIAVAEGKPRLARAILDELAADGTLSAAAGDASDAHLRRTQVALALGDRAAADQHLVAAAAATAAITDPVLRGRFTADLEFVRALATLDPRRQIAAFARAEAGFRATGFHYRLPAVLLERGLALARAGHVVEAERTVRQGLSLLDEERGAGLWLDQGTVVGRVFDGMVAAALERGDAAEAFRWAEAGRASGLHGALATSEGGDPLALDARRVRAEIDPRTALLLYTLLPDRAVVFVVTRDAVRVHTLGLPTEQLRQLAASFASDVSAGTWSERTLSVARGLYLALVTPLALDPALSRLAIVADEELHSVPFAALVDPKKGDFLLEQHELVAAPSAAVYLHAQAAARRAPLHAATALVVGDPRLDPVLYPSLPTLPSAAAEARAVAGLYPGAELLLGSRATRGRVLGALGRHGVLHFAGHATINAADPRLSGLPLASDAGEPAGLHAQDVSKLALGDTRVVVLSACDTARGPVRAGEGPMSLARAFLAARVPSVVATLWPVSDGDTGPLLAELHRRLRRGDDAAAALRAAQLTLLRSRQAELRSPTRWAAFQAIGG